MNNIYATVTFTFDLILIMFESLYIMRVAEPQMHFDEGFSALDTEHVPWFGFRQKLTNWALRQTQNCLSKQFLS